MADWTNNNYQHFEVRDSDLNRSLCLDKTNVINMLDYFDSIFGGLVDFSNTISSITLYPFKILPYRHTTGENYLKTVNGVFQDITAYGIDYSSYYMTLGEFYVKPYFNNFADYKGYTQIKVFLPFMGWADIDVNECMGKWLQFRLSVDYNTGKGMYIIGVSDSSISIANPPYPTLTEDGTMRAIATFECEIGIEIPIGRSNIGDIKRNLLLGTIKTIAAAGVASYVGSLAPAVTTTTSHTEFEVQGRSLEKGSRLKTMRSGESDTVKTTTTRRPVDKSKPISEVIDGSIDTLNRLHIWGNTDRVNDAGLMWQMTGSVKVVIYRPKMLPTDSEYDFLYGKPYGAVNLLSRMSGYTTMSNFHLEGEDFGKATETELGMLHNALMDGIILPERAITFSVNSLSYSALQGMTWADWIENGQGETFRYDANGVYTPENYIIKYDGKNVKSSDLIISTNYVAVRQSFEFYIASTVHTALLGQTWAEWIDEGQGSGGEFRYTNTAVYKTVDDVNYAIRLNDIDVLPTQQIEPTQYTLFHYGG